VGCQITMKKRKKVNLVKEKRDKVPLRLNVRAGKENINIGEEGEEGRKRVPCNGCEGGELELSLSTKTERRKNFNHQSEGKRGKDIHPLLQLKDSHEQA